MSANKFKVLPILVTGAGGMLGSDLVETLSKAWGNNAIVPTDFKELDITNLRKVDEFVGRYSFSGIINAAAYTDVDKAETEREKAYRLNMVGPQNLTIVASKLQIPVIHFSTDYVFDGLAHRPLTEEDVPCPPKPNYYGETKLLGEMEVLKNPNNLVLRLQWLYGKQSDRFSVLREKKIFTPFEDQWGAPTWTRDVSRTVVELMESNAKGLFHFSYDDFTNWFEVFSFVKAELNLTTELTPKKSSDVHLPARRPTYGVMSNKKLLTQLGKKSMGSWKTALKEFLSQI